MTSSPSSSTLRSPSSSTTPLHSPLALPPPPPLHQSAYPPVRDRKGGGSYVHGGEEEGRGRGGASNAGGRSRRGERRVERRPREEAAQPADIRPPRVLVQSVYYLLMPSAGGEEAKAVKDTLLSLRGVLRRPDYRGAEGTGGKSSIPRSSRCGTTAPGAGETVPR